MTVLSILNNAGSWIDNEVDIYMDLVEENFQATGTDVHYLPKDQINLDEIFGESTISQFKAGFIIEMFLHRISNFNGDNDMFSKFGMSHSDEATLLVSTRRFKTEGMSSGLDQPLEEDLIYMQFSNTIWKIRKVKFDEDYYQFGRNHVWRLEVGLYDPSHETFESQAVEDSDIGQSSNQVDDIGLINILGISRDSPQDESDVFTRATQEIIPTTFDSTNPFGE